MNQQTQDQIETALQLSRTARKQENRGHHEAAYNSRILASKLLRIADKELS